MRFAVFEDVLPTTEGLPEGVLAFDLVTKKLDTYRTRLYPEGAVFRGAKPWLDSHNSETCKAVIGKMTGIVEQNTERLAVAVLFDLEDQTAKEIHGKHVRGFLPGCSIGFDPIEWHVEVEDGQKVVHYTKYHVLEGSSCGVPSNPDSLVRQARLIEADIVEFEKRATPTPAPAPAPHTPSPKQRQPMKREALFAHRQMIGDSLRAAHDHMFLSTMLDGDIRQYHVDECRSAMNRAVRMARIVNEALEAGHDDAADDAALVTSLMRQAPEGMDSEIVAEWSKAQREALPKCSRTFADVAQTMGYKNPQELSAGVRTLQAAQKALVQMRRAEQEATATREHNERMVVIERMRTSGIGLDPATECEMLGIDASDPDRKKRSGEPWTLVQMHNYESSLNMSGLKTPIVRAADPRQATVDPLTPPAAPSRTPPAVDPAVDAALAAAAKATGMSLESFRKAAVSIK